MGDVELVELEDGVEGIGVVDVIGIVEVCLRFLIFW